MGRLLMAMCGERGAHMYEIVCLSGEFAFCELLLVHLYVLCYI